MFTQAEYTGSIEKIYVMSTMGEHTFALGWGQPSVHVSTADRATRFASSWPPGMFEMYQ
jgi:hypothetical protein